MKKLIIVSFLAITGILCLNAQQQSSTTTTAKQPIKVKRANPVLKIDQNPVPAANFPATKNTPAAKPENTSPKSSETVPKKGG